MQAQVRTPGWSVSESRGTPLEAFGRQIIPIGRVLQARWPGGGLTWHRPVRVEVYQNEEVNYLPIRNVTRIAIFTMVLAGVFVAVFVSLSSRGRRKQRRNRS